MHRTQNEIANDAGITQPMVSAILAGKKRPSPTVAKKLEKATGIPRLSWLYPDEYPNPMLKVKGTNGD